LSSAHSGEKRKRRAVIPFAVSIETTFNGAELLAAGGRDAALCRQFVQMGDQAQNEARAKKMIFSKIFLGKDPLFPLESRCLQSKEP
jgi:hypothetical protein